MALLGPGSNNDANAQVGSFSIDGQGGDHQDVNRTGFGVEVGATGGLSGVFQLSNDQINGLTGGLTPPGNGGQGGGTGGQGGTLGGGNMGTLSGETGVITAGNSSLTGSLTNLTDNLNNTSTQAAQDARSGGDNVADGATTLEQLRVATGTGHYDFTGDYMSSGSKIGTMTATCLIDFGNQTIGGPGSSITIDSSSNYPNPTYPTITSSSDSAHSFSEISNGVFHFTKLDFFEPSGSIPVGSGDVTFALSNHNGVTAQQNNMTLNYTQDPSASTSLPSGIGTATGTLQSGS